MEQESSLLEFKIEISVDVKVVVYDYDPGYNGNGMAYSSLDVITKKV
jgi:hypothetical protein